VIIPVVVLAPVALTAFVRLGESERRDR